jgi:hypothetical protein
MVKFLSLFVWLCCSINLFAQTSFTPDSVRVSASYPSNAHVFYPWIELTNNTGQLLEMRCVKVLDQKPAAWETWLEDLDSAYTYVPDTTTFFLPAVNQQAQYMIVSFHPHNTVGRSTVVLKLYPANDPTDSVLLTFAGNAYASPIDTNTAINEINSWLFNVSLYPQPSAHTLHIKANGLKGVEQLFAVDILGRQIPLLWQLVDASLIEVSLQHLERGTYLLVLQDRTGRSFTKAFVKQ